MSPTTATIWRRVTKHSPCPICNRPDWCGTADDGAVVRCMRVESAHPCRADAGGWIHHMVDAPRNPEPMARPLPVRVPARDFAPIAERWARHLGPERLAAFADSLGVTPESLRALGCGLASPEALRDLGMAWHDRGCFSFPCRDAERRVIGIKLRPMGGKQFYVPGSKAGVFLHHGHSHDPLLIVEGQTDAAAGLVLGFDVLGRPCCTGATNIIVSLTQGRDVVIVADADAPGRRGAEVLATAVLPTLRSLRVIEPPAPHKDLRAWLQAGATRQNLLDLIAAASVRQLRVRFGHG